MTINLSAQIRKVPTTTLNTQRVGGLISAEVYGKNQENTHLFVERSVLEKVLAAAGESSLINLTVDGKNPINVLIHGVQKHPVSDRITHVDFYQVDMKRASHFKIPLMFIGESKAVKEQEGTLVKSIDELEVSCLPGDLIHEIEVNISALENIGDVIRVKDLIVPEKITVKNDPEETVVSAAKHFEEAAAPVAEATAPVAEAVAGQEAAIAESVGKDGESKKK